LLKNKIKNYERSNFTTQHNTTQHSVGFAHKRKGNFYLSKFVIVILALALQATAQTAWNINGNTGVNNMFLGTTTQTDLLFKTNLVERLRITAAGYVGIGVVLPTQRLDVNGNLRVRGTLFVDNDIVTNFGQMTSDFMDVGLINVGDVTANKIDVDTIKPYVIKMNQLSKIIGEVKFEELVRINDKLGLGVANPTDKLEVDGGNVRFRQSFKVDGNQQLDGTLGIGTSNPTEKFEVSGGNAKFGGEKIILGTDNFSISNRVVNGFPNLYLGTNYPLDPEPTNFACYSPGAEGTPFPIVDGPATNVEQQLNLYKMSNANPNIIKHKLTFGLDGQNGMIELKGSNFGNTNNTAPPSLLINYYCGKDVYICTGANGGKVHIGSSQNNDAFNVSGNSYFNGKVHIGTTVPNGIHSDALASIDGKLVVKSCYVNTTSWADNVFSKNYTLTPLAEVEKYYQQNKHLPEIPTEKEVIENGVNTSEMITLLLKKVEELTLYTVQQQKEIEALKTKIK
jgi:hypothetical protein